MEGRFLPYSPFRRELGELIEFGEGFVHYDGHTTKIPQAAVINNICINAARHLNIDIDRVFEDSFYIQCYLMDDMYINRRNGKSGGDMTWADAQEFTITKGEENYGDPGYI